jgi:hypothetical protein
VSAFKEAISAIRDAIKLADDVKRTGETVKEVAKELREHDRRITRLEAQWDTALALSGGGSRDITSATKRIGKKD